MTDADTTPGQIVLPPGAERPEPTPEPEPEVETEAETEDAPAKSEEPVEPDWTETEFPIEVFDNKIVIKRADVDEMSDGGIIIPESARRGEYRTMTGTVIATGPGIQRGDGTHVPMRVKVGETVVFEKFRSMTPVVINTFTYHVLAETDLFGKLAEGGSVKVR